MGSLSIICRLSSLHHLLSRESCAGDGLHSLFQDYNFRSYAARRVRLGFEQAQGTDAALSYQVRIYHATDGSFLSVALLIWSLSRLSAHGPPTGGVGSLEDAAKAVGSLTDVSEHGKVRHGRAGRGCSRSGQGVREEERGKRKRARAECVALVRVGAPRADVGSCAARHASWRWGQASPFLS